MGHRYSTCFKWISIGVDFSLLNLVLWLSFELGKFGIGKDQAIGPSLYPLTLLLANLWWFFCSQLLELYQGVLLRESKLTIRDSLFTLALWIGGVFALQGILIRYSLPGSSLTFACALFSMLLISWKFGFLLLRKSKRLFWVNPKKVIILGALPSGLRLYHKIKSNPQQGYVVVGIFEDKSCGHPLIKGRVKDSLSFAKANGVSEIYCALPPNYNDQVKVLMRQAERHLIRFKLVPDIKGLFDSNIMVELYGSIPVLTPYQTMSEYRGNQNGKMGFGLSYYKLLSWLTPSHLPLKGDSGPEPVNQVGLPTPQFSYLNRQPQEPSTMEANLG